jgi:hypothetical protein
MQQRQTALRPRWQCRGISICGRCGGSVRESRDPAGLIGLAPAATIAPIGTTGAGAHAGSLGFLRAARSATAVLVMTVLALAGCGITFPQRQDRGFGRQKSASLGRFRSLTVSRAGHDGNGVPAVAGRRLSGLGARLLGSISSVD